MTPEERAREVFPDGYMKDLYDRVVRAWSATMDDRSLSDEARWFSEDEAGLTSMPDSVGAWKASLMVAFDAGRQLGRAEKDLEQRGRAGT